jgi:hypothetical protein
VEFVAGCPVVGHENISGGEETAVVGPASDEDVALPEILKVGWWGRRQPVVKMTGFGGRVVLDQLLDCHGTHACAKLAFNKFRSGVGYNSSNVGGGSDWISGGGFAAESRGWSQSVGRVCETLSLLSFGDDDSTLERDMNVVRDDGSGDEQFVELDPEQLHCKVCRDVGTEAERVGVALETVPPFAQFHVSGTVDVFKELCLSSRLSSGRDGVKGSGCSIPAGPLSLSGAWGLGVIHVTIREPGEGI